MINRSTAQPLNRSTAQPLNRPIAKASSGINKPAAWSQNGDFRPNLLKSKMKI
jgi:hypothetical protein